VTNPPASLDLPSLSPFEPPAPAAGETLTVLEGPTATPSRVLAALDEATEIEFHAHGVMDLDVSDVSFLALSPDPDGDYALTAGQLRQHRLRGAPLVILAACHAARPAPYRFASWSLPIAFIDAGARAVVASISPIIDSEARGFFQAISHAISDGERPAVAVRDARVRFLAANPTTSLANVVLFE
jgi:CHAT domain-containing protein